ncbi:MAG: carbon-nitrogen hydrolase family protein [Spirosomataceae bacterium]
MAMKICAAQIRPTKGDIEQNIAQHKALIALAMNYGAEFIFFPELSLTGYEPELAQALATHPNDSRLDDFQIISDKHQLTIGAGMPLRNESGITISMILFQPNQPRQVYSKKYLHADEQPFFVSGESTAELIGPQNEVALAICYELSVPEHAAKAHRNGAKVYVASVAKSAAGVEKAAETLSQIAEKYTMTVVMANAVGFCDNFESAGKSGVWNSQGELLAELNNVQEGILIFDTETQTTVIKGM